MKEMLSTNSSKQGALNMKKSLVVIAMALALVFAFAATAMAVGPFYDAAAYNPNYPGYLSWSWATRQRW